MLDLIWIPGLVAEAVMAAYIVRRRLLSSWPSLVVYSAASLPVDLLLAGSARNSWTYYYTYWVWIGVSALLRIWVLADVIVAFPGSRLIAPRVRLAVLSFATCTAVGAWAIASRDVRAHHSTLRSSMAMLDVALNYSWLSFVVVALAAIWFRRLSWARRNALVAAGLTFKAAGSLICSYLIATAPTSTRSWAVPANMFVSFAALVSWAVAFVVPEAIYLPTPQSSTSEKADLACTP